MTLSELKEPFEQNIKLSKYELDKYSCNDIVSLYLSSSIMQDKNVYISYLIVKSWNLLQKIYYVNNNANLSCEECYDIFIQTLNYVISKHVWDNEDSSLFEDPNAFLKAMAITIQCRKKNFINAKFKYKRVANNNYLSLDSLQEDFQEGFFTPYEETYDELVDSIIEKRIKYYFEKKKYISAFILEGILFYNLFDDNNDLDIKKLRKYLRHLDNNFCTYFSTKYLLNEKEVLHSLNYFKYDTQDKLDKKIQQSFITLKNDDIISKILNV